MKKLKSKIFASFMLLVVFLAVAGAISIYEFRKLSLSVHGLIDDNYKSIEAARTMIESLEREDSGILLLLLGETTNASKIINSADSAFLSAMNVAKNNLTEKNEDLLIDSIQKNYILFKHKLDSINTSLSGNEKISSYTNNIHPVFLKVKKSVNELMSVNQTSLHNNASDLREKSKRALMPGIVAILSALIFTVLLNFFIARYFVNPITEIVDAVNKAGKDDLYLNCNITSDDEIKKLENAINSLLARLSKK